jgi:non-specific serine/threonine protein kinase
MRNAISWSYGLLDAEEQRFFRTISVFAGGFSLTSADSLWGTLAGPGAAAAFDLVGALVECNLVYSVLDEADEPRFAMLETIRELGLEQLAETGEQPAAQRAHGEHFAGLTDAEQSGLKRLEREHDNIRAALAAAFTPETGDFEIALRLCGSLWWFWQVRGHLHEGTRWLERTFSSPALASSSFPARIKGLAAAGLFSWARGDMARAEAYLDEGLALARQSEVQPVEIPFLHFLSLVAWWKRDWEATQSLASTAYRLAEQSGDEAWMGNTAISWAVAEIRQGSFDQAQVRLQQALARHRALGSLRGVAWTLQTLAELEDARGNLHGAAALRAESLAICWEQGDLWGICEEFGCLGHALASTRPVQAAQLLGMSESLRAEIGVAPRYGWEWHQESLEAARSRLELSTFETALAYGRSLPLDQAVAETARMLELLSHAAGSRLPAGLSEREVEVLSLAGQGLTNAQIADRLFLSKRTVEAHLRRIYDKIDAPSREDAVAFARLHGWC